MAEQTPETRAEEPRAEEQGLDAADADVLDEVDAPGDVVGGPAKPTDADVLDEVDVTSDVMGGAEAPTDVVGGADAPTDVLASEPEQDQGRA